MISYIFQIGIVFITFQGLWWVFLFVIKLIVGAADVERVQRIEKLLKPVSLVLLTALAAVKSIEFLEKGELMLGTYVYPALGAVLLYLYLMEKVRSKKARFTFVNGRLQVVSEKQSRSDQLIVYCLIALYGVFVFMPYTVQNPFTSWLGTTINDLYDTPVIGWIIGLLGVFFLLRMIFMGIALVAKLFSRVDQHRQQRAEAKENDFVDYEIVEDDDEEPQDRGNLLGQ